MDDLVEIAVFAGNGRPYFERHRIGSGEQRITVTISRKPESVGVDPYNNLIQRVKDGKVVALEELGTTPWAAEYRARSYDSTRVTIPLPNFEDDGDRPLPSRTMDGLSLGRGPRESTSLASPACAKS